MVEEFPVKTKMLMQLHYSRLSEKDRRQYAALESLKLGRGGIAYISALLNIDRKTLWQGRNELISDSESSLPKGRQRRQGGGRKKNDSSPRNKRITHRFN
jgi:hypothetical protein